MVAVCRKVTTTMSSIIKETNQKKQIQRNRSKETTKKHPKKPQRKHPHRDRRTGASCGEYTGTATSALPARFRRCRPRRRWSRRWTPPPCRRIECGWRWPAGCCTETAKDKGQESPNNTGQHIIPGPPFNTIQHHSRSTIQHHSK